MRLKKQGRVAWDHPSTQQGPRDGRVVGRMNGVTSKSKKNPPGSTWMVHATFIYLYIYIPILIYMFILFYITSKI